MPGPSPRAPSPASRSPSSATSSSPGCPPTSRWRSPARSGTWSASIAGWAIGDYGGRPYLERHGRWLHLDEAKLDRAESVVRPLGQLGRAGRPGDARRALLHLDPGRRLPLAVRPLRGAHRDRLGDLVLRAGRRRLGGRGSWDDLHQSLELLDYAVAVLVVAGIAAARVEAVPATSRCLRRRAIPRAAPTMTRMIPLVDVKAQYAPLIPELLERIAGVLESGRFIFGPEVAGVRGGGRGVSRRAARGRRRERHRCAGALAGSARDRGGRRGDLPLVHLLRHGGGDRAGRRDAGLRGHRSRHAEPRRGRRRGADHASGRRRCCRCISSAGRRT